jgi:Cysteine-rich secretory protein family
VKATISRGERVVNSNRNTITRRSFLETSAAFALGLGAVARGQIPIERGRFSEDDIPLAREQLLRQVNAERANAHLGQLQLDDLACSVANDHARDMIQGNFLSHWGSDGRKPYHRYSLAGGTDAVRENVSSAESIQSVTTTGVRRDLYDMHQSMLEEVPPNDGHRKTILFPQLSHVGFGIALAGHNLRLDELYLARYVEVDPIPRELKPKEGVVLRGRILNPMHLLNGIDVFFEPLPSAPAIEWLRVARSYGLPQVVDHLLPRLPDSFFYPNGTSGTIQISNKTRFKVRLGFSQRPGINTIVVWLKAGQSGDAFPATEICVRVE